MDSPRPASGMTVAMGWFSPVCAALLAWVLTAGPIAAQPVTLYTGTLLEVRAEAIEVVATGSQPLVCFDLVVSGLGGFLPGSFDGVMLDGLPNGVDGITGSLIHGGDYDSHFLYDPALTVVIDPTLIPGYVADDQALTGLFALSSAALAPEWRLARIYSPPGEAVALDFTIGQPGVELSEYVAASFTLVEAGDANLDGAVDISDFVALKQHYGQGQAGWGDGDFNGDGAVDISDFVILKQNYGTTAAGLSIAAR